MSLGHTIAVYSRGEHGHRGDYLKFVETLFNVRRLSRGELFRTKLPLLFLMVEDSFALYVAIGFWRAALGRPTVGLLFRPGPAISGTSLRHRLKRSILKLLMTLPTVKTLTIVPFSIAPQFSEIADGWIYDFQLWDLDSAADGSVERDLVKTISASAAGRTVVTAIGTQDTHKGFDLFANTWVSDASIRTSHLFTYGGKLALALGGLSDEFEKAGGLAANKKLSDKELLALYAASDLVWCWYSEEYDQASGILGRALQLGIPVIVRSGSLSHRFCVEEGVQHVAADRAGVIAALSTATARDASEGRRRIERYKLHSLAVLSTALKDPEFSRER